MFVAGFTELPPPSKEITRHMKWVFMEGQWMDGQPDGQQQNIMPPQPTVSLLLNVLTVNPTNAIENPADMQQVKSRTTRTKPQDQAKRLHVQAKVKTTIYQIT